MFSDPPPYSPSTLKSPKHVVFAILSVQSVKFKNTCRDTFLVKQIRANNFSPKVRLSPTLVEADCRLGGRIVRRDGHWELLLLVVPKISWWLPICTLYVAKPQSPHYLQEKEQAHPTPFHAYLLFSSFFIVTLMVQWILISKCLAMKGNKHWPLTGPYAC